jgi:hypothetical protein
MDLWLFTSNIKQEYFRRKVYLEFDLIELEFVTEHKKSSK